MPWAWGISFCGNCCGSDIGVMLETSEERGCSRQASLGWVGSGEGGVTKDEKELGSSLRRSNGRESAAQTLSKRNRPSDADPTRRREKTLFHCPAQRYGEQLENAIVPV